MCLNDSIFNLLLDPLPSCNSHHHRRVIVNSFVRRRLMLQETEADVTGNFCRRASCVSRSCSS